MSNHFSADNLKFPGDDRRLDLTDVFAFTAPHDPDTTVLIIDSNPTSAPPPIPAPVTGPEFYPGAVYRINIDTDGDNLADVAFTLQHGRSAFAHRLAVVAASPAEAADAAGGLRPRLAEPSTQALSPAGAYSSSP